MPPVLLWRFIWASSLFEGTMTLPIYAITLHFYIWPIIVALPTQVIAVQLRPHNAVLWQRQSSMAPWYAYIQYPLTTALNMLAMVIALPFG